MTYAYDELYLHDAKLELGGMFDYAINDCQLEQDWVAEIFVFSGYATLFETGNPWIVGGMSGIELAQLMLAKCAGWDNFPEPNYILDKSPEYWAGWALAEYQWFTGKRFQDIFRKVQLSEVIAMYPLYHEMDITQFIDCMDSKIQESKVETRLKYLRTHLGLSQRQLAQATGVNIRNIQLYEQRINKIDNASAIILYKLARTLSCRMEDLLEDVG